MSAKRARQKEQPEDPRREFPPGCTCLDWSYFKERRPRPLCPVHKIPEPTVGEILGMRRVNRYTERE